MLSYFKDKIVGWKKVSEDSLYLWQFPDFLDKLGENSRGNIEFFRGRKKDSFLEGLSPKEIGEFVDEQFSSIRNSYTDIISKAYAMNKTILRHNIKILQGEKEIALFAREVKYSPWKKAFIEFLTYNPQLAKEIANK